MTKLKHFFKIIEQVGYPNPKVASIKKMIDYDDDTFLYDLKKEIGEKGVVDFCDKAIEKLSGDKGIKVELGGSNGDEYCFVKVYPMYYDENESRNDVVSSFKWGESKIFARLYQDGSDQEPMVGYFTVQEIIDVTDMSGWSDLDELLDYVKEKAYKIVYSNCGFGIWWE